MQLRLGADVGVLALRPGQGLRVRATVPALDQRVWRAESLTRVGDPTLGGAWTQPVAARVTLVASASVTLATHASRPVASGLSDGLPEARLADGLHAADLLLTALFLNGPVWWEFDIGARTRWFSDESARVDRRLREDGARDQVTAALSASFPVLPQFGVRGQAGARLWLHLPPGLDERPVLRNGVGPEAQGAAWWLNLEWLTRSGIAPGIGLDGGYFSYGVPDDLVWRARLSWYPRTRAEGRGFSLRERLGER
jgi:hypothetical protein